MIWKRIRKYLENIMVAITFAESGDDKTARKILEKKKKEKRKRPRLRL